MRIPFFGSFYTLDSVSADAQTCLNLIPEVIESGGGKNSGRLRGTPGLAPFATLPFSNVLALWAGEGRLFAVAGTAPAHLYEVFADGTHNDHGAVGNAVLLPGGSTEYCPAQIFPNGNQIMVIHGGYVWVDNGSGVAPVDFSIQLTGLQVDNTGNGLISGAGFQASDVGCTIEIQAGLGFTIQNVVITSVNPSGVAYFAGGVGVWGTANSTGGSGLEILGAHDFTDLYTLASPFLVGSLTYLFQQSDVGRTLQITAGGGWLAGSYLITGLMLGATGEPTGIAILNAAPAGGSATGGYGTEQVGGQIPAGTGTYQDTYGIIAAPSSKNYYISAIDDFTTWSSIDEGTKEGYPDNILALFADHELVWIFGDLESTEIWQDTGNANFPFQRLQSGGLIHFGLAAQYSVVQLGLNGMGWLAWSSGRGAVQAVYAQGLTPQRVSTHAIEQVWRGYPTVQDCISYDYIEDGHDFWVMHFPSGNATWVYDLTASTQMNQPVWHQRAYWNGTWATTPSPSSVGVPNLARQLQRSHAYGWLYAHGAAAQTGLTHFVGDHTSGNIYIQSLTALSDNGAAIFRQRACPHLSQEDLWAYFSLFRLDAEVGNQNITIALDYSRDFGHNFINPLSLTALAAPNAAAPDVSGYSTRLRWRRLGRAMDFVPRVTTYSIAKVSFTDAYLEFMQGTS